MVQPEVNEHKDNLTIRIISAAVLGPVVLFAVYFGTPFFEILISLSVLIMIQEWVRLCRKQLGWLIVGLLYIAFACLSLLFIRFNSNYGQNNLLWLFLIVWSADIGAYAFGRLIGGLKLAPIISPNKTWAGLIGGIFLSALTGGALAYILEQEALTIMIFLSATVGAISQAGDLMESFIKRYFKVKDTGNIIPGHGGLLDRVDGLLLAAIFVAIIDVLSQDGIFTWI
ncbi:MAG: phosphatidate cytidylyltransferase [Pseudomonadota bacterium]|nr:phosphatidate cytidylyltransferase [Pseudomonadota bacterium]